MHGSRTICAEYGYKCGGNILNGRPMEPGEVSEQKEGTHAVDMKIFTIFSGSIYPSFGYPNG